MRISSQRFACAQCGRCCRGFDVVVTPAEIDLYRRRNAAQWFDDDGSTSNDPFEPIPGAALQRIRKRSDGACGFLTAENRCRIHEELGAGKKPLTCRLFPFAIHNAADGVVVTASFNCPTIAANEGPSISEPASLARFDALRKEWFAIHPSKPTVLELVKGRAMSTRSLLLLRQNLLAMLSADSSDLRSNVLRIVSVLEDLTRRRVLALSEADFAEYVSLTVPHAAARREAPPAREMGAITRLLQYGFLYAVIAVRDGIAHPGQSRTATRLRRLRLLAHFHGLAPGLDGVNVQLLKGRAVDINDEQIRPVVFHYLRSAIETLGAGGSPIVDELSVAVSYLNAACALAAMRAAADGSSVNREIFIQSLIEAADAAHGKHPLLDRILKHLGGGTDAMVALACAN